MQTFFEWFERGEANADKPWLILGKGPTFGKRQQFDLRPYRLLSLNHVVREQQVDVAHIIDLDVVNACAAELVTNARVVVLPWVPHVDNRPGRDNLQHLVTIHPVLRELEQRNALAWYNLQTAIEHRPGSPVVRVRYFSAEAALNLLVRAGVRQVRTLGVDGGATYNSAFADLAGQTLLANRRSSFDRQFEEIAKTIMESGVDYAPLDVEAPVRVYVATAEAQMLAVRVLEYSIRRHASMTVAVTPMHEAGLQIPMPRDPKNRPRTPFSFQRFLIPALAGYRGRAIYLDSDMQVFRDIRALWTLPLENADLLAVREPEATGRRPQFSVMLLNCSSLRWDIQDIVSALDHGDLTYEQLMYEMRIGKTIGRDIDPAWNSLERFEEGRTALVHYTDMDKQPWISCDNPLGYLWVRELRRSVESGFISLDDVREHVARGFVRPSLVYQLQHDIDDPLLLPKSAQALDRQFVPPYEALGLPRARPWTNPMRALRAAVRHVYERSFLHRLERKIKNRLTQ